MRAPETAAAAAGEMTGDRGDMQPLLSADEIAARVRQLARDISVGYAGKRPLVVGVLKGAWVFMADLVRLLTVPVTCDFVKLSSYGGATHTSGAVRLQLDLSLPARGRDLLVVEDVIDTGTCIGWLLDHWLGTLPWLLITGAALGFASGLYMLIRAARKVFRD